MERFKMHLILGGARSGKSRFAEEGARHFNNVLYIATGQANDKEMQRRIELHQKDRPSHWGLVEEPLELAKIINEISPEVDCILIECMTLWLSNWLCLEKTVQWEQQKIDFLTAVKACSSAVYIVSNEVGSGVVPLGELSRKFVDEAGWLNQALAKIATDVTLVVAGCPLKLKSTPLEKSKK
jgi:adenosylcobinamide kinase / adenosylcobinamide-phosphate guanylyltransferase